MEDDDKDVKKLVPGEPVPQFGGMTPEQFSQLGDQIENLLLTTFNSYDGAMTMYNTLAVRLVLDVEEAKGPDAARQVLDAMQVMLREELSGQRKLRALAKQRTEQAQATTPTTTGTIH